MIGTWDMCHHEPKCLQTMHKCFGLLATLAFYDDYDCCDGSSSPLSQLMKPYGASLKLDTGLLKMNQEVLKKAPPLQIEIKKLKAEAVEMQKKKE